MSTSSKTAIYGQIVDVKSGNLTPAGLKTLQVWQQQLSNGFDPNGNLISNIEPSVEVIGHPGDLGTILQHLDGSGVIDSPGMTPATDTAQGAVLMPAGAPSNHLGTAAIQNSTAFDPAGSANTALISANAHADAVAATAQSNSETYTDNKFVPGLTVTIVTAALTGGGTQGSMQFQDGLLIAQTPAT